MSSPPELALSLAGAFEAGADLPDAPASMTLDDVRRFLVAQVEALLAHEPARLLSILYRVDVAEPKVKHVLSTSPPAQIPAHLADLLIERQLQKLRLRRAYSPPPPNDDSSF